MGHSGPAISDLGVHVTTIPHAALLEGRAPAGPTSPTRDTRREASRRAARCRENSDPIRSSSTASGAFRARHAHTTRNATRPSKMLSICACALALVATPSSRLSANLRVATSRMMCDPPKPPNPLKPPEPPKPPAVTPPVANAGDPEVTYSDDWSGAGKYSDQDPLPLSFWLLGPKPRRGVLASLGIWGLIAPATNLWGTGSFFLSLMPDVARDAKLDTFYPVSARPLYPYSQGFLNYDVPGAFKRYVDEAQRFEFRYPATYVQDQAIFMKNQDAAYNRRMMDPTLAATPSRNGMPSRRSQQGVAVAVGPEGKGTGAENLSVVIGSLAPGFTLRGTLGSPEEGAQRLLEATINKQTVVEKTTLLAATERTSARSGLPLYQFGAQGSRRRPSSHAASARECSRTIASPRLPCSSSQDLRLDSRPGRVPCRLCGRCAAAFLHDLRRRRRARLSLHVCLACARRRLGVQGG